MATCFAGLMCHAPIVVPEVGEARAMECARTTRAMSEVASRAILSRPDRLVLVSPHSPRHRQSYAAWPGRHVGDLGDFRAPQLRVDLPDAPEVAEFLGLPAIDLEATSARHGRQWLDHGAMVPLVFLWRAGWRGPTAILALPWVTDAPGEDLGRALAGLQGRTAVIASGDMSHRLIPGAPAGFDPQAAAFDRAFIRALRADDWRGAMAAEPRERAAEDVVESTRVAMGAAGEPLNAEVLSYEGPWGVGYGEAILYDPQPPLYAVARSAVRAAVRGETWGMPPDSPDSAGVFVTLWKKGELRGCIGHIEPFHELLYEEIGACARASSQSAGMMRPVGFEGVDT
ncbi:MAG: AMMECR1 domain-containing protein [Myxococcota bacterium]|nr:AMMECR1 domain-containing protein [Myxococcota bacterium]